MACTHRIYVTASNHYVWLLNNVITLFDAFSLPKGYFIIYIYIKVLSEITAKAWAGRLYVLFKPHCSFGNWVVGLHVDSIESIRIPDNDIEITR